MQQITLTFEAQGESMRQDTDQETAKAIKAAGSVEAVSPPAPMPTDTCWPLATPTGPFLQPLTAL